jgi:hypothetical protein
LSAAIWTLRKREALREARRVASAAAAEARRVASAAAAAPAAVPAAASACAADASPCQQGPTLNLQCEVLRTQTL